MNRIRVLQVLWNDDFGGAERHSLDLVTHLDRSLFECEICVLHEDRDLISRGAREVGIPVHHMKLKSAFSVRGPGKFRRFVRKKGYDIIHGHTYPLWMPIVVGRFTESAWMVTLHGLIPTFRSIVMNRLSRSATDCYIVPSAEYKRVMMKRYGVDECNIHIVYHGIDLSRFSPSEEERSRERNELGLGEDELAIGSVGRLAEEKNYPCFIRSAMRIHNELPNTRFFIVGAGIEEDNLRRMVREAKAEDYITFLGRRTDVHSLLSAFDLFLFTSLRESFGIVVAEAMAKEVPVVVSETGGLPEVVGDTGVLVRVNDDASFSREVVTLLRDESRRRDLAGRARDRARSFFSMEKMVDNISEIYTTLLEVKRKGPSGKARN